MSELCPPARKTRDMQLVTTRLGRFLVTPRRLRDARLPSAPGLKQARPAGLRFLALAPVHPRCTACLGRFLVTPRSPRGRVDKPSDSAAKQLGHRPALVCRHPLRAYLPCSGIRRFSE